MFLLDCLVQLADNQRNKKKRFLYFKRIILYFFVAPKGNAFSCWWAINPLVSGMEAYEVFLWQFGGALVLYLVCRVYLKFAKKPEKTGRQEAPAETETSVTERVEWDCEDPYARSKKMGWRGGWPYIGGKYKEIKISDYRAVFCYKYFPSGKYGPEQLNDIDYAHQQEILSFKRGEYYKAVELVSGFINGLFWDSSRKGWMLCVIPASTLWKNERRFRKFCELVAKETGIIDGYSLIRRERDRPNSRREKGEDTLDGLWLNESVFVGKKVLLFDDITTRGTSFVQLADNLISCGASQVVGFFIGKTVF